MAGNYAIICPRAEMVAYAQQSIHSALALGDGVVPIRETREPIISALLSCYSHRIAYDGNAPRRERHKLLKKELRAIVEDAATMQGLERRNVVQIHLNGNQLGDIVLASVDGVSAGGSVYWVRANGYSSNGRLTDYLGPEP